TCLRDELATTDKNTAVRDELIRTTRLLTAARQKLTINRVALRAAQKRVVDLETRVTARTAELDVLARSFTALTDSTCWKITKPLRIAGGWVAEPVRRVARRAVKAVGRVFNASIASPAGSDKVPRSPVRDSLKDAYELEVLGVFNKAWYGGTS